MACLWIIIEADQAPSGCKEFHCPNVRRGWDVSGQEPRKSSFYPISGFEVPAPTYQQQHTDEAMAIAILKSSLSPVIPAQNATSSIPQQLDVAKWRPWRVVEWHRAPPVPDSSQIL
jgi:hypothetical protein